MKPEKHNAKLETELLHRADSGDTQSQLELGLFYEKQKKLDKAEEWYLKATEDYNDDALILLGSLYLATLGKTS